MTSESAKPSHKATGATGVTVLGAVLTQLRAIGPRKVAVFTPYVEDLTNAIASSLAEAGYPPLTAEGMRIRANLEIGAVPPSEIVGFVESRVERCAPDGSVANSEVRGGDGLHARWELRGDAEDRMDELALRDGIAFRN
jgi:maleate cis-trans isomerase